MLRDTNRAKNDRGQSFIIKQNLTGKNIKEWVKEFEKNEQSRIHQRSNNVKIFHEILSFHRDEKHLTMEKLQDIGKKYLELRNENAVALAVPHQDKEHLHLHIALSGVEAKTGRALRVSQAEFKAIKQQIQEYQLQKYPELTKSIVDHSGKRKEKPKDREFQLIKRTHKVSEKDRTKQTLEQCFKQALSQADFIKRVSQAGLKVYERGGKPTGIEGDRKMRFSNLGFGLSKLSDLDNRATRLNEIESLRKESQAQDVEKDVDDYDYPRLDDDTKSEIEREKDDLDSPDVDDFDGDDGSYDNVEDQ